MAKRQQRVRLHGEGNKNEIKESKWETVERGVPQGSILGPLLYILYAQDLNNSVKYSKYHQFADDTQIFIQSTPQSYNSVIKKLQKDLNEICKWSEKNSLRLNEQKSCFMAIASRHILNNLDFSKDTLMINNVPLNAVDYSKNLGIVLDKYLCWDKHVAHVTKTVIAKLKSLFHLKNILNTQTKQYLVQTLIMPNIQYGCPVYANISKSLTAKLQKIQNCCIRYIYNIKRSDHVTPFYRKSQWLTVENLILYYMITLFHSVLLNQSPKYLYDKIKINSWSEKSKYARRNRHKFNIPAHRTVLYNKSFLISAIRQWNKLPTSITENCNIVSFKKNMKKYLLSQQ